MLRCVLVSTDKACEPTTVYGRTKALAEDIFRTAIAYTGALHCRISCTSIRAQRIVDTGNRSAPGFISLNATSP